jgi:general stress protein CsbA
MKKPLILAGIILILGFIFQDKSITVNFSDTYVLITMSIVSMIAAGFVLAISAVVQLLKQK